MTTITDALTTVGVAAFGHGMPVLAPAWTSGGTPTESIGDGGMSLDAATGTTWRAPLAGEIRPVATGADLGVTLVGAGGAPISSAGTLLVVFPHAHLRLARLYAQVLEDPASSPRPERALGLPARPVPRYFYFASPTVATTAGNVASGDDLGVGGTLTVHDACGLPIDPVATAAAFYALMDAHHPLQKRALTDAFDADPQVKTIGAHSAAPATVRLRLSDHAGLPYDGAHLKGITPVATASGVFTLDAAGGGTGSDLSGKVEKEAATSGSTGSFPAEDERVLKLGLGTTGRMTGNVVFPARPSTVTLGRDFFAIRVVKLDDYLLGSPDVSWAGAEAELPPTVRVHEPLNLHADGNDVLGAAAAALATTPLTESLVVAQSISGAFDVPPAAGPAAYWPAWPAPGISQASPGPLPITLRAGFTPTAAFYDDGVQSTANTDVVLELNGLPPDASVRVYNRRFGLDAREERGDGAGGIAAQDGSVMLLLRDPFGLRTPGAAESTILIPAVAVLHCDVVVVKRSGESRIYGGVTASVVNPPLTTLAPPSGANSFEAATARRGISDAGVLGVQPVSSSLLDNPLSAALTLFSDADPRNAPRLPTMARRELVVAGLSLASGGAWKSVLAGGRLTAETHSAMPRLGSPGGAGGRETQVVGVSSHNGRLAYDIARTAFRRTTNVVTRVDELADGKWDEPPQPGELAVASPSTSSQGTFAAAVLQTIANGVETPELSILRNFVGDLSLVPDSFDLLVDWVKSKLTDAKAAVPQGIPKRQEVMDGLDALIAKLDDLKDDTTLNTSTKERLYDELRRELMSSCYGRRDAQWSLQGAISGARRFIYIESPGFTRTAVSATGGATASHGVDLVDAIAQRLSAAPGLRVLICTPKHPAYGPGYEGFASGEVAERLAAIEGLPTAAEAEPSSNRVVAFHPVGFPGRPSRLESTVVIVDDVWALVGASTFRRRGMTFDGGSDVVFTDTDLVNGISPSIQSFRRQLQAVRLGVSPPDLAPLPVLPEASWVNLADGQSAAFVVRDMLRGGGLGRIERYWRGTEPGFIPPPPVPKMSRDPDAEDPDYSFALTLAATLGAL
ncbi:MAG TPA: hypothetical protein VG318_17960 [Actinomycetota bacterium]|nr:hypothetical protein [Actinomycetota bacterium]